MISAVRPRRGFTKVELVVVVVIIAILAMVALQNFIEAQTRSLTPRIRSDQRTMATALESYFADHGSYSASTTNFADQVDRAAYRKPPKVLGTTFRSHTSGLATLTTPVAYLTSYFSDISPYISDSTAADSVGTFRYYSDGKGWILGAWGRDMDQAQGGQLYWDGGIERIYDSSLSDPGELIRTGTGLRGAYTYDPTNGTYSAGDIWRMAEPKPRKAGT